MAAASVSLSTASFVQASIVLALARTRGDRLLFKGDDVEHTDIAPAI